MADFKDKGLSNANIPFLAMITKMCEEAGVKGEKGDNLGHHGCFKAIAKVTERKSSKMSHPSQESRPKARKGAARREEWNEIIVSNCEAIQTALRRGKRKMDKHMRYVKYCAEKIGVFTNEPYVPTMEDEQPTTSEEDEDDEEDEEEMSFLSRHVARTMVFGKDGGKICFLFPYLGVEKELEEGVGEEEEEEEEEDDEEEEKDKLISPNRREGVKASSNSNRRNAGSSSPNPIIQTLRTTAAKFHQFLAQAETTLTILTSEKIDQNQEQEKGKLDDQSKLLDSNSGTVESLKSLLQWEMEAGKDREALEIVKKLASAQPEETEWKFLMARMLSETGST
ncbi:hypothetical protein RHMOL_Rhmol09G0125000 [Rhododendron molle]|uniref:Uncharacterized protein n=1 Tax=Rhododendron molle TaxID=49168 RepID=A0ACC0MEB2_RHOML|nr:hypothetical protein RHMOL_Rhmol09G0125000 [Rhododendron molle]